MATYPGTRAQVWIAGQRYDRCESEYHHKRCADRVGHDGRHHNSHLWWTASEAAGQSTYPGTRKSPENATPDEVERAIAGERIPYPPENTVPGMCARGNHSLCLVPNDETGCPGFVEEPYPDPEPGKAIICTLSTEDGQVVAGYITDPARGLVGQFPLDGEENPQETAAEVLHARGYQCITEWEQAENGNWSAQVKLLSEIYG